MLAYPYIPSLFALLLILIHLIRITFMIHDGKYMQKVTSVGGYHGKITEKITTCSHNCSLLRKSFSSSFTDHSLKTAPYHHLLRYVFLRSVGIREKTSVLRSEPSGAVASLRNNASWTKPSLRATAALRAFFSSQRICTRLAWRVLKA
jgi:hypothetical protein